MASLDRLANRQRMMEQNSGLGQADLKNGSSTTDSNVNGNNGGGFPVGVRDLISLLSLRCMLCDKVTATNRVRLITAQ